MSSHHSITMTDLSAYEDLVVEAFEPLCSRLVEDYEVESKVEDYPNLLTSPKRVIPEAEGRWVYVEYFDSPIGTYDHAYLTDCRDLLAFVTSYPRGLLVSTGLAETIREFLQLIEKSVDIRIDCLAIFIEDQEDALDVPEKAYPYVKDVKTVAKELIACPTAYYLAEFDAYMNDGCP